MTTRDLWRLGYDARADVAVLDAIHPAHGTWSVWELMPKSATTVRECDAFVLGWRAFEYDMREAVALRLGGMR